MKVKDLGFFGKYVSVNADDPVSEAAKEMVQHRALGFQQGEEQGGCFYQL
jgi:hypothetical protein